MIKGQILVFLLRWLVSSVGMWLCISWFGQVSAPTNAVLFIMAGLIFSLINSIVKPLAKLFTLPLAIFTMGISTLLINVGMVALTLQFLPGIEMDIWGFIASSIVLSLINGLANLLMPAYNKK